MPAATISRRVFVWFVGATLVVAAAVGFVLLRTARSPVSRNWSAEWLAEPPVVETTPGGLLEAATVRMTEEFYKSDRKTWWGIYLGETVSEIQVAAVYRYGVPLTDPAWQIVTHGQVAVVSAPALRPSLPVAIDTATLQERTESGWARFDKQANLEALRQSLSSELEARAADPARLALARDAARRTIGEFVEHWLTTRGDWDPGPYRAVTVSFPDDAPR